LTHIGAYRDLSGVGRVVTAGLAAREGTFAGAKKALGKVG
jgi:hypothetical protein